ncbi:MAG: hypothetical protein JW864_12045 [Spirochaetes bacterium]|nr:hypothetical protein [Spirochaetota bacterium]
MNNEGESGKYIIQELHDPNLGSPEFQKMYKKFSDRILWIDNNVFEGAFQMNTAWYFNVPEIDPVFEEHIHDHDELIGFFGSNPDDKYDLGAEIHVTLDGEVHKLTRTSMIFCPAGMKHMPLSIKRVDRPIFHFSIVIGPEYGSAGAYK